MLDLEELEQLTAFAELGTLSRAAEALHLSTPSLTRSMRHLEDQFGVPLFIRGKNRIQLNDTGRLAVAQARIVLRAAADAVDQVRAYDLRQRTIVVRSCAPAPLWELQKALNTAYPGMTVSSSIDPNEEVARALSDGSCDLGILPFPLSEGAEPFLRESLFVCVPPDHPLARQECLTFREIDGFNFLLRSELGFWDGLCREKMPASKFLVQTDDAVFDELVLASSLPCFTTDYFNRNGSPYPGRVHIPLTDPEANVTFYLSGLAALIHRLVRRT